MNIKLDIITPGKILFSEEVDWVRVPGSKGSFAMLKGHLPIVSTLEPGLIKIVQHTNERYFEIFESAIVEQHDNHVTIIAISIEEAHPLFLR